MTKLSWNKLPLKDLFRLDTTSCLPASQPEQAFLHHSIPAWDESGGPVVELGNTIGSNKFLISHPCVLVSKLNPRKSRVSVVRDLRSEFPQCASTEFMVYVPIHEDADIGFYGWYMTFEYFQRELERVATGTTNSHVRVTPKETLNWKIAQPPLPEQHRIAKILETIDEIIQKTESLISKLKAMKQGLLHDLLTRGLDKNGKLRDPKAHPEQFKDSPIGRIPKEWDVRTLEKTATLQRGFDLPIQQRKFGDVPVFGSNGIDGYHNKTNVKGPGVITGRSGTIGSVYYSEKSYWPLNTTLYIKNFHGNYAKFIALLLQSIRLHRFTAATGVPSLNRNIVHPILIVVPEVKEQEHIVQVAEDFDLRLKSETQYRDKLILQKKGLMHDLLTGKVRVKV